MSWSTPGSVASTSSRLPGASERARSCVRITGSGHNKPRASSSAASAMDVSDMPRLRQLAHRQRRDVERDNGSIEGMQRDGDALGIAALTVTREDSRGECQVVVSRCTVHERKWAEVALGSQVHEALAVALEEMVLAVLSADDQFEVRRGPNVTPDLQQHDVVQLVVLATARMPQIGELRRITRIGQETAASCRLRPLRESEAFRELDLRFAIAPVEREEALAVHPALALRQCRRQ